MAVVMSGSTNLKISAEDLAFIRSLEDFDLIMLLSELHHHGWTNRHHPGLGAKNLLPLIRNALKQREKRKVQ